MFDGGLPDYDARALQGDAMHPKLCNIAACVVAGRERLKDYLEARKVLVVIDDADDVAQLENLLPPCRLLSSSRAIITSCKKDVLKSRRAKVREVQLLPEGHDMQLFQAWAFPAGPPAWDTSVLVPELVACCGRLPLALKVCVCSCCERGCKHSGGRVGLLHSRQNQSTGSSHACRSWAPT